MGSNKTERDILVSVIIELYKSKIVLKFYILTSGVVFCFLLLL